MFSKTNLISTLFGFIVLFLGGYLFYEVIAKSLYESHTTASGVAVMRAEPNLVFIALGCLIQAFIISTLYSKWASGAHSAKQGFEYGAWIGGLLGFGVWVLNHGVMDISDTTILLVDGIWNIVFYGIAGVVIGMAYSKFSKA